METDVHHHEDDDEEIMRKKKLQVVDDYIYCRRGNVNVNSNIVLCFVSNVDEYLLNSGVQNS